MTANTTGHLIRDLEQLRAVAPLPDPAFRQVFARLVALGGFAGG